MNNRIKDTLIFLVGVGIGTAVTYKLISDKFKQMADDEINDVVEYYKNKEKELSEKTKKKNSRKKDLQEEINEHIENIQESIDDLEVEEDISDAEFEEKEKIEAEEGVAPYVITPEELGNIYGYDVKEWTLYADDVLLDENESVVDDEQNIIGDALRHFGEYEDDVVCARNENLQCDYEIVKDSRKYDEVYPQA